MDASGRLTALVLAGATACGFALIEGGLRLYGYVPRVFAPIGFYAPDPETGWALRPENQCAWDTPRGEIVYRINSQGVRADENIPPPSPGMPRILVIGDSQTFGLDVRIEETFVEALRRHSAAQVVNLGVPSYGTRQAHRRLARYWEELGPANAVVYAFNPNDPLDDLTGPREIVDGILIQSSWRFKRGLVWLASAYGRSRALALVLDCIHLRTDAFREARKVKRRELLALGHDAPALQALQGSLAELTAWTRARNVRLLVAETATSEYSPELERLLAERSIPFLQAKDALRALGTGRRSIGPYWHWNPDTHRVFGRAIADRLLAAGWLRPSSPRKTAESRHAPRPAAARGARLRDKGEALGGSPPDRDERR